ncbi:hypothetical protein PYTT13_13090 [Paracoccus yeei]|uniref:Peptidase A2 domain-containing protein n=1 Tax=Paracoccus yeei TaxID=147645 RepID=A0A2D2C299_9RHOB|nr:hypothetical protein PYTT13_13090 [Paracoccus yeei]
MQVILPRAIESRGDQTVVLWDDEPWRSVWALVDTGADHNVIDKNLAQRLGWVPHGQASMTGFGHQEMVPVYDQKVFFPSCRNLCDASFVGSSLTDIGNYMPLIIGMAVIRLGVLTMDFRAQKFELSFI